MRITYTGPLPEGRVENPMTGISYAFVRGEQFEAPENVAVQLATQSPGEWILEGGE